MDLSIIIPCYNEVDNIPKLEREFVPVVAELARSCSVEVVFVDDGCTDGTVEALQKAFRTKSETEEQPDSASRREPPPT